MADLRDCWTYDVPFAEWGIASNDVLDLLEPLEPDEFVAGVLRRLESPMLDDSHRARALRLWERHSRWTTAQLHESVLALAGPSRGRGPVADLDQTASEIEIGFALGVTDTFAAGQISSARTLHRVLTRTAAALRHGEISAAHVRALVTETADVDADTARAVEEVALRPAHRTKVLGQFTTVVRKALREADPRTAAERAAIAKTKRGISLRPLPHGLASFRVIMPAADAAVCHRSVDALARRNRRRQPDDGRTLAEWQADALTDVLRAALADPSLPEEHGSPITIAVTTDLETMLGLADHPATLEGYGTIDADTARDLAADAPWKLLILDAIHGHLVGLSSRSYRPSPRIAEFLRHRDAGTCTVPRCNAPVFRCDIDHRTPFDHDDPSRGGPTDVSNLHNLCEHHHLAKHGGCLSVHQLDERTVEWVTRAGLRYPAEHPDLRPLTVRRAAEPGDLDREPAPPPPPRTPPPLDDEPPF